MNKSDWVKLAIAQIKLDQLQVKTAVNANVVVFFLKKLGIDSGRCKLIPPKKLSSLEVIWVFGGVMSPSPFTSLFFMISIWIRLTISVSMKSREIKGRGTRPALGRMERAPQLGLWLLS